MVKATVLIVKEDKSLVLSTEGLYYIIKRKCIEGESIMFDKEDALAMPSYLFAIAAIEDPSLDETMQFIKNEWFKKKD